jgi:pimeloyl-ACP methyl ester carboxylesterase
MSRRTLGITLAAPFLALAIGLAGVNAAAAALSFSPCLDAAGFSCTTLSVPLDRTGDLPGTITLSVERRTAGAAPSASAVVALAGGPGQAALPLAESFARELAPALGTRDLLVFDQRGSGASDPLRCSALSNFATAAIGQRAERCALQIGPDRSAYTTRESVEDIEALRQAAGYEKLVLYGVSYGTKVALEYAERYPQHVEALVLDSVVASDGPEPFAVPTFQAIKSVLSELCSNRVCAGITSDPLGDVARLAARLAKHALRGVVFDGSGHRVSVTVNENGLLDVLLAGDLNFELRALLPGAVRSALHHDPAPLLRLYRFSQGLIATPPKGQRGGVSGVSESVDEALFLTTSCEEKPFPWQRSSSPAARLSEARAALRALPSADFYPFNASTALANSLIPSCAAWPYESAGAPQPAGPLPNVPTLILSGGEDLRTPTSTAREVAALIPDSQLVRVPYTGHGVLANTPLINLNGSGCGELALTAFFDRTAVAPCTSGAQLYPTPVAPTELADLHAPSGFAGKPGRTLAAALATIFDLESQILAATLQAEQEPASGSSFGGLSGGEARLTSSAAILEGFSYVPGVRLYGAYPLRGQLEPSTIRVSGPAASHGSIRFGPGERVRGTLGGRGFLLLLSSICPPQGC